jgi:hypothetical protein
MCWGLSGLELSLPPAPKYTLIVTFTLLIFHNPVKETRPACREAA